MKKKRSISVSAALMLVMLAVVATFNIVFFVAAEYYNKRLEGLQVLEQEYKKFKEVAEVVSKSFIGEYDAAKAMDGAMAGYIDGLGDKWSHYYTKEQVEAIQESDKNTYSGIGVTLSADEETPYLITAVAKGGPAEKAGVRPMDVIISVNDKPSESYESRDALVGDVRGEKGTSVKIEVQRGEEKLSFDITRDEIPNECVETRMLDNGIGLVTITGFETGVDKEFETKVTDLVAQGAGALIFDLRFNPGGYVDVMYKMLDLLLPEGLVISMTDHTGSKPVEYFSDAHRIELPMAVIVNEYSYSAAEFFAAATQEYGVATVVGDHTTGKGYAQNLLILSDGSGINLSTARYYTPKGASLATTGVTPDVSVSLTEDQMYSFYTLKDAEDSQLQAAIAAVQGH